MVFDQSEFDIRCEWGSHGARELAPISDAVIIVDLMSFSTSVSIAIARGAHVIPFRRNDPTKFSFAKSQNAELAKSRGSGPYSLSPASIQMIPSGTRLVLPSPNGSAISLSTGMTPTFAGCLRNAKAVALAAQKYGPKIAVIPAGERWSDDDSMRPAFEDLIGAGAIIQHLTGRLSPDAFAAVAAYRAVEMNIFEVLMQCSSGKELIERGYESDLELIADLDADTKAPVLRDGMYVSANP